MRDEDWWRREQAIRDFDRKLQAYMDAIEPLTQERVRLYALFSEVTVGLDGRLKTGLPPSLRCIDEQYVALIKRQHARFFGSEELAKGGER